MLEGMGEPPSQWWIQGVAVVSTETPSERVHALN